MLISSALSSFLYATDNKNSMFIGVYGGGNMPHKDYKDYKDSIDTIIGGQVGFEFYDKNINTVGIRTYFDTGHTLGAYWYDKNPSVNVRFHSYNINGEALIRLVPWLGIFYGVGLGYHNWILDQGSIHSVIISVNAGILVYLGNNMNLELRIRPSTLFVDIPSGHFSANRNLGFTLGVNFVF